MDINDRRIQEAVRHTEILRAPRQTLSTFGITNVYYYLVTKPVYCELEKGTTETVIREGRVIAEKPRVVTPYYLSNLEGFSLEAKKYFEMLFNTYGSNAPGLFYTYKNEPKELNIVSDDLISVVNKLNDRIDKRGDPLTSIIKGEDALWDVSLMKFIYELTLNSVKGNLQEMESRGLLNIDADGITTDIRMNIEESFQKTANGDFAPAELKAELDRWGVFTEYQDRFFTLF